MRSEATLHKAQMTSGALEFPTLSNNATADTLAAQQKQLEELNTKLNQLNFLGENSTKPTINNISDNNDRSRDKTSVRFSDDRRRDYNRSDSGERYRDASRSRDDRYRDSSRNRDDRYRSTSRGREDRYRDSSRYRDNRRYRDSSRDRGGYHRESRHRDNRQPQQGTQNNQRQHSKSPAPRAQTPNSESGTSQRNHDYQGVKCYRCDGFNHIAKQCRTRNPSRLRRHDK